MQTIIESSFLVRLFEASIAPVTMISGVGLLLLSMTNRYGRVIDRTRHVLREMKSENDERIYNSMKRQIQVLFKRAKLLRLVIVLACTSIFFTVINISLLFAIQLYGVHLGNVSVWCFIFSLLSLIASIVLFVNEISVSLRALEMRIKDYI